MLGVRRDATTEEIRRAWIVRARHLHPDAGEADDDRAMQLANEAWHVLRDPARRLAHDRDLGIDHGPRWAPPPAASVPLSEQIDDPAPRAPRAGDNLVLVPPALLAGAVACFALGTIMLSAPLLALGLGLLVLSGVAFVVAPFVALARDRRSRR